MMLSFRLPLLLLALVAFGAAAHFPPPTTLSGIVRDATSLMPLRGASVQALQQGRAIAATTTDTAGRFTLT
ncbi:MAG TPA: hypothetical protein PKD78_09890, partial [Saprospiraceae bacterium]|nr:hypothetical protein [Saprospiraceae bacterium]